MTREKPEEIRNRAERLLEIHGILSDHKLWLETDGKEGKKANLSEANFFEANFFEADLSNTDLSKADLSGADLRKANFVRADLREADLSRAYLCEADFVGANLSRADLFAANLCRANLSGADLSGAHLSGANFAFVKDIFSFSLGKDFGYAWKKNKKTIVRIGCEERSLSIWLKEYKNIGKDKNYNKEEISRYYLMLQLIQKNMK